ncbi:MAG TPA: hypothetical protein VGI81_29140 [Tepidisphaeraceae bacterium]|jgi:hypothetical protein
MPWYAAHAIMYFRFKSGPQDRFSVWENVLLIEAAEGEDPWPKAIERAKQDEGDCKGTLVWDGRPAELRFAGIRKIISVSQLGDGPLASGDELTYSELLVTDEESLRRLAAGESVNVEYVD